jgi:L-lactate dehydrogenase (cytochrome)
MGLFMMLQVPFRNFGVFYIKLTIIGFLDSHPGGAKVILRCAGKDATKAFDSVHAPEILMELPKDALRGHIDPIEVKVRRDEEEKSPKQIEQDHKKPPHLQTLINLGDFEKVAQSYLPATAWAYYSSGADDEISKRNNARAFSKLALRPRVLRKVSSVNTTASILEFSTSLPVYISPVGIAKFAHPDGECALAAAAGKEGLVQVLANGSSMPIEQVAKSRTSPNQPLFQQLYVNKDIKKSVETIRRAEMAGAGAIWITVDSPVVGKREMDERLNLSISVCILRSVSKFIRLTNSRLLIVMKRDKG